MLPGQLILATGMKDIFFALLTQGQIETHSQKKHLLSKKRRCHSLFYHVRIVWQHRSSYWRFDTQISSANVTSSIISTNSNTIARVRVFSSKSINKHNSVFNF